MKVWMCAPGPEMELWLTIPGVNVSQASEESIVRTASIETERLSSLFFPLMSTILIFNMLIMMLKKRCFLTNLIIP